MKYPFNVNCQVCACYQSMLLIVLSATRDLLEISNLLFTQWWEMNADQEMNGMCMGWCGGGGGGWGLKRVSYSKEECERALLLTLHVNGKKGLNKWQRTVGGRASVQPERKWNEKVQSGRPLIHHDKWERPWPRGYLIPHGGLYAPARVLCAPKWK